MRTTKPTHVVVACLLVAAFACSSDDAPTPPAPAPNSFTTAERVRVATEEQAENATVLADRIVFPKAIGQSLLDLKPDDVLVGDCHSLAAKSNRYGFARIVTVARVEGDTVVVETARDASLEDVYTKASFKHVAPLDQFIVLPLADGQVAQAGVSTQTLKLAKTFTTKLGGSFAPLSLGKHSLALPFVVRGKKGKLQVEAALDFTTLNFDFAPTIDLGLTIGGLIPSRLEHFHFIANGDTNLEMMLFADGSISLGVETNLVKEEKYDLAALIEQWLGQNPDPSSTPKFESPDLVNMEVGGPPLGILPTTYELSIKLICGITLKGSASGERGVTASSKLTVGAAYDVPGGWATGSSGEFTHQITGRGFTKGGGSLSVQCALKPKLAFKLAAAAGPYVGLEVGKKLTGAFTETCPSPYPSGLPDGTLTVKTEFYAKGVLGGEIKVLGREVADVESGFVLFDKSYPVLSKSWPLQDRYSIGTCPGLLDAGADGSTSIDPMDAGTDAGFDAGFDAGPPEPCVPTSLGAPNVQSIETAPYCPGMRIRMNGTGMGAIGSTLCFMIDGKEAAASVGGTSGVGLYADVEIPPNAAAGAYAATLKGLGGTDYIDMTLQPTVMPSTSSGPAQAKAGDVIVLTGQGLTNATWTYYDSAKLRDVDLSVVSATATTVSLQLPADIPLGYAAINPHVAGGAASCGRPFGLGRAVMIVAP